MPGYGVLAPSPGGKVRSKKYSISVTVMDLHGNTDSASIGIWDDQPSEGEVDDWVEAYGELSNALVVGHRIITEYSISPSTGEAYDEAYAGIGAKAVFVFQSQSQPRLVWRVPVFAPDASWMTPQGDIIIDHSDVDRLIDRTLDRINDGGLVGDGDFVFSHAYFTDGDGGARRRNAKVLVGNIDEPTLGDSPSQEPA